MCMVSIVLTCNIIMMTQVFTGPPTITTHPTSQLTNISMSVTLDCEGTGEGMITYHWETSNLNGRQWTINGDSNSKTLIVRNLEQSQQYRCVMSNEAGSTRSDVATITVLSKLFVKINICCTPHVLLTEITLHPVNSTTIIALEDVTLTCSASVDDVAYSWHRVGGTLPSQSQGQNNNTFTIDRVTPHDEGMYYCVARKSGIRVESTSALVAVDGKTCICNFISEKSP